MAGPSLPDSISTNAAPQDSSYRWYALGLLTAVYVINFHGMTYGTAYWTS